MKKFTILLLYPSYVAETYGQETYQAWVEAASVEEAIEKAQVEASGGDSPQDFFVLAAYEGHHEDIKG